VPLAGSHGESIEAAVSQGLISASLVDVTKKGECENRPRRETRDGNHEQIKYRFNISVIAKAMSSFINPGPPPTAPGGGGRQMYGHFIDVSPTFCHSVKTLTKT
jgi:hypothetical protein